MNELDKIVEKISCDTIDMNYMEGFEDNLQRFKNEIITIKAKDYREIFASSILLGEKIVDLFREAQKKYKEKVRVNIEDFKKNELYCNEKRNQNFELNGKIRELRKKVKKEHDYKKKQELQISLKKSELVVSLNKNGIEISIDNYRAELLARYEIYKELAEQVNNAFNPTDDSNEKEKMSKYIELIKAISGVTKLGTVLTVTAIIKAIAELMNSFDAIQVDENRINSLNEQYELLNRRCIGYVLAYLAIKIYLEDWEFVKEFCNDENATLKKMVTE